jgi:multiple sugar transport system substrate-binding protein
LPDSATIRGVAWDHPRAVNPLEAVSSLWKADRPLEVEWKARSLQAFENQPLEELASEYDLVLMDYPFTGAAAASALISPAEDWTDEAYLDDQKRHSVGPSFASYTFEGRQWALAIDAACQVSASRPDLWPDDADTGLADSWSGVAALASRLRETPSRVAMPLNPNHAYCAFVSLGLSDRGRQFWPVGDFCSREDGVASLRYLKRLARDLHPASQTDDPIGISDRMAQSDEIVFVPLMFGYSNYARAGFRERLLSFGNAPRGSGNSRGSVLGGVGIAVSTQSTLREEAADLARTLASPAVQAGLYVDSGGQPGHARAWDSDAANAQVGGFFDATRETIEQAFVRPRVPGHRLFQQKAGELVHEYLWSDRLDEGACMDRIHRLFEEYLADWGALEHHSSTQPGPPLWKSERTQHG